MIALTQLHKTSSEGGTRLPNIRMYNPAALLYHALDWLMGELLYSNMDIKEAGAYPWKLEALLHAKISKLPIHIHSNIMYKDTVFAWRETLRLIGKFPLFTKFTPILGNPMYPQGTNSEVYRQWEHRGPIFLSHL